MDATFEQSNTTRINILIITAFAKNRCLPFAPKHPPPPPRLNPVDDQVTLKV